MIPVRRTVLLCLALANIASADVAYDNLTDQQRVGTLVYGGHEVAQDVSLDPSAGLEIVGVSLRLRNPLWNYDDSGTLTISLYADAGGRPGDLLVADGQPFQMPRNSNAIFFTTFAPFLAPSGDLWAAWHIRHDGQNGTGVDFGGLPFIGSTTGHYFARPGGVGEWTDNGAGHEETFHIRVTAVPEPAAALPLLLLGARRRR